MADYLIRARVIEHKSVLGRRSYVASVTTVPISSEDILPASDIHEEQCESREAAHEANERMIQELSREVSGRGDRVLGVKID